MTGRRSDRHSCCYRPKSRRSVLSFQSLEVLFGAGLGFVAVDSQVYTQIQMGCPQLKSFDSLGATTLPVGLAWRYM